MCGIFGAITSSIFTREDHDRFVHAADLVSYRGPDDRGSVALRLQTETPHLNDAAFDVFLGFRRLAILDLSPAGHQPMHDGQGRWIIFNGEIFNYVELRDELRALGHTFHTGSDTEVLLHLYAQFGEDGFDKLNGMWAFAIVDLPNRKIVLSRDRFSIKPLYLLESEDRIVFGSEIKQLLPFAPEIQMDPAVMSSFLAQGLLDHEEATFFRGIRRLKPKHSLVLSVKNGRLHREEKQYWDYPSADNIHPLSLTDATQHFRDLLLDSIRLRLRSDVSVGVLLSGGLDSSSIAALAKPMSGGSVETYSVVSSDKRYSEESFVDTLTAAHNLHTRKLTFESDHVEEALQQVLHHSDEPVISFSVVAQYKLFQRIKQDAGATVLLSGQGGDEVLLGYLKFFFLHVRKLLASGQYGSGLRHLAHSALQRTAVMQFSFGEARRYLPGLNRFASVLRQPTPFVNLAGNNGLRGRQIADLDALSVPALTHYEDRNSMAHSLEVRHPFLDHRLVEFLVNLPIEYKLHKGWTKYILRQALPELPDSIRWRRDKQGFITAEQRWLRQDFRALIQSAFRNSTLAEHGVLDDHQFLSYYDQFCRGKAISYTDISRVLIAELWARQALKGQPLQQEAVAA